jgi:hypothetical protein
LIIVGSELTRSIIDTPYKTSTPFVNSSTRILLIKTAVYISGPKIYIIASARAPFRISSRGGKDNTTLALLRIIRDRIYRVDSIYILNKAFVKSSTLLLYIAKVMTQSFIAHLKKDIITAAFK